MTVTAPRRRLTRRNPAWPRNAVYNATAPFHTYYQWFAVWFPAAVGVLGGGYYLLVQRQRTGVLAEHRAEHRHAGAVARVAAAVTPRSSDATPDTAG